MRLARTPVPLSASAISSPCAYAGKAGMIPRRRSSATVIENVGYQLARGGDQLLSILQREPGSGRSPVAWTYRS